MKSNVHIGPAGWSYPDWDGIVYPDKRSRASGHFDALEYLSSYFNLIEINSTFYRVPSPATCASWASRVAHNPGFTFTLKAHQSFTHRNAGDVLPLDVDAFKRAIEPLMTEDKLGCVLLQFPWSFRDGDESRRRIASLTDTFHPFPLAIEIRHGSWGRAPGIDFLTQTGVTVCGIDQPVIGDSVTPRTHSRGPAGEYFRFHGRNAREWFRKGANRDSRYDYTYSHKELSPWAEAIRRASQSSDRVFVVLNNHFRGQAPLNAFEMTWMLTGKKVRAPATLARAYPRLREIAELDHEAEGQTGWLFD